MSFAGFGGFMGPDIGSGLVRVAAGLCVRPDDVLDQMRAELNQGFRSAGAGAQQLRGVNDQLDGAVRRTNRLSTALKGLTLGAGLLAVTGFGAMVKSAIQFESAFAGVEKTVDASKETLAALRQQIIDMSKEMPVAATELARIGESAGALGIPTDSIQDFIKVVSTIGTTTNVSVDEAATALGQLSNILDMTTKDYNAFAATLVDLGNKGASTEKEILEIARRFGGSAKQFGLDPKYILALSSAAANLGMQPELAGSTLSRLVDRLVSISGSIDMIGQMADRANLPVAKFMAIAQDGGDKQADLAKSLGITAKQLKNLITGSESLSALERGIGMTHEQFARLRDTHPEEIFARLFQSMKGMTGAERQMFMQGFMGPAASAGGGAGMQRLINGMSESVNKNLIPSLDNATNAWRDQTAAQEEAAKRYKTTASQWQLLQNQLNAIAIEAGTTFLPTLEVITGFLSDALPKGLRALGDLWNNYLREPMDRVVQAGAGLIDVLGKILLDWGPGGAGSSATTVFETMAEAVGSLVGHLASLLDILKDLLSNPIIGGLAKFYVLIAGISLAVRAMRSIRGMLGGLGNAALGLGSLGRMGGGIDTAATTQIKAAQTQVAAAEMQLKAATGQRLSPAASAMVERMALAQGAGVYRNQTGAIGYSGMASPFATMPLTSNYGQASSMMSSRYMRGMSALGSGMVLQAGKQFMLGARDAVRGGLSLVGRGIAGGIGVLGRLFWPALIVDLVGSLAQQPIADMIRSNTSLNRLADAWGRSWLEGIGALFEVAASGGRDTFVGRPGSYDIGGHKVDTGALRVIADQLGDDSQLRMLMDAVEGAQTQIDQLAALANLSRYIDQHRDALRDTFNIDPAEMVAAGLQDLFGNREQALDTLTGSIGKYDALGRATKDIVTDAMTGLLGAIYKAAEEAGLDLKGYELAQLGFPALKRLGNVMGADLPGELGFLRQWVAGQEIEGARLGRYTKPEDIAGGAKNINDATDALARWTSEQSKAFGPSVWSDLNRFVNEYQRLFGDGGIADNASDRQRLGYLRNSGLFNEELAGVSMKGGLSKRERELIDQYWEQFATYYADAAKAVGRDQSASIADSARDLVVGGLETGMSLKEIAKDLPWDALWDGIGKPPEDAADRLGEAIRTVMSEAMSKATTAEGQNDAIAKWNKMWQGVPGMQINKQGGAGWGQLTNMVAASMSADVLGAGDADAQNAALKAFNKMMPKGQKLSSFKALKNLVQSDDVQALSSQIQNFAEMGMQGGLTGAAQQTAAAMDTILKPVWDAVTGSNPSRLPAPLAPEVGTLIGVGRFMADTVFQGLTERWSQRISGFSFSAPGAVPPAPVGNHAPPLPGGSGSGTRNTTVNIANVTNLGPTDDQSLAARLGFMAATV